MLFHIIIHVSISILPAVRIKVELRAVRKMIEEVYCKIIACKSLVFKVPKIVRFYFEGQVSLNKEAAEGLIKSNYVKSFILEFSLLSHKVKNVDKGLDRDSYDSQDTNNSKDS